MIWQDILLERTVTPSGLRDGIVAAGLAGNAEAVEIVDSMDGVSGKPGVNVVCEQIRRGGGDFPLQLAVYVYDVLPNEATEVVARFAQAVGCRCLISDDSEAPYRMLLLAPGELPLVVDVDPNALDEREEYILTR